MTLRLSLLSGSLQDSSDTFQDVFSQSTILMLSYLETKARGYHSPRFISVTAIILAWRRWLAWRLWIAARAITVR